MNANELLILNQGNFLGGVEELYRQLNSSPAFREQFLLDPAGVLSLTVFTEFESPTVGAINQANRILFSLLSNPKFREWAHGFQQRISAQIDEAAQSADRVEAIKMIVARLDR